MVARGRVQNGVVVLAEGVHLPEGQEVTVLASPAAIPHQKQPLEVSTDQHQALLQLIGICKTDFPPDDDQVERILEQERMKKYG